MIFLVRHAKAGQRNDSVDADMQRPLSKAGWIQSNAIVAPLLEAGAGRILLASPYVRCMQTLEPLAAALDLKVVADDRLAEAQPLGALLEMIAEQPDGAVLCSHGDMIPDTMAALQRRGCDFIGEPNWKKASVWVIERDASGNATTARCWSPPR
jgi:8-oxo-dGTP diphosphatase